MFRKMVSVIALLAAATGVSKANAQTWYGRVDAGYSVDGSLDVDRRVTPQETIIGGDGSLSEDWSAHLAIGHAYANGLRAELEASRRENDIDRATGFGNGSDVNVWAGMLNGYYDFNRAGRVQPYVGLGLGVAQVEASIASGASKVDDEDTGFAYQGIVGVAVKATERLAIDLGYRYFVVPETEFAGSGVSLDGDYTHQAVTLGLRWAFGQAAAAPVEPTPPVATPPAPPTTPPPAAPTCVPSSVTVYFDWNRADLNADGAATLERAVTDAQGCSFGQVTVAGHTDRSGSTRYNEALSQRRAAVVREALVSRGVPAGNIVTQALGEGQPAKATADGVREPLNRRTAVSISFN